MRFLIVLVMLIPFALSSSAVFFIEDNSVKTSIVLEGFNGKEVKLPYDFSDLNVEGDFEIYGDSLRVLSDNVRINFTSSSILEGGFRRGILVFSADFLYGADKVSVLLPKGSVLSDNRVIFPKGFLTKSDGQRIILEWSDFPENDLVVSFEFAGKSNIPFFVFLALILAVGFFYRERIFRLFSKKRALEDLTKNLFREEKEIVEFLFANGGVAWTKEICRALGISKVRLSRKLKNLEARSIILRVPFGNEKRIFLVSSRNKSFHKSVK
ncbi:hypothetical protein D6829_01285 [Candidatus Pacearchaeota archaeon]|nr:MAG: hypothetical protein D6829_01285 [Candidatus Pacearchaeota archaeon]